MRDGIKKFKRRTYNKIQTFTVQQTYFVFFLLLFGHSNGNQLHKTDEVNSRIRFSSTNIYY